MPRKAIPVEPNQCDGPYTDPYDDTKVDQDKRCTNMVKKTKDSKSGFHYCSNKACQAKRVREYQRTKAQTKKFNADQLRVAIVNDALRGERVNCPKCGFIGALPGWLHPNHPAAESDVCLAFIEDDKALQRSKLVGPDLFKVIFPKSEWNFAEIAATPEPALPTEPTPPPAPPAPPFPPAPPIADTPPF